MNKVYVSEAKRELLLLELGYVGRIVQAGNPILLAEAALVNEPESLQSRILAERMVWHMQEAGGVGLAAPQLGVSLQAIVFWVPLHRQLAPSDRLPSEASPNENAVTEAVHILFNPSFTPLEDTIVDGIEGCLSMPGLRGIVPRYRSIRYTGYDANGHKVEEIAHDFHARVLQHEIDHLHGILYPQKMIDLSTLAFEDELQRLYQETNPKSDGPESEDKSE